MKLPSSLFNFIILIVLIALVIFLYPAFLTAQEHPNTITFDNQAGEYATVKLVGPTLTSIEVPNGEKRTVHAAKGEYYILTRYGTDPNQYKFSKGEAFEVTQSKTKYSKTTITLYPVIDGNYSTTPISKEDFDNIKAINWENVRNKTEKVDINDVVIAAKYGDNIAQFFLGIIYVEGAPDNGVEKDLVEAEYWWCKSAYQGNWAAFTNLMVLYNNSDDQMVVDDVNVIKEIIENAKNNDPISQYRLGVRFENGLNFKKNLNEAMNWYKLSAQQNFAPSQYKLANLYLEGNGINPNYEEAAKWYKMAAINGNAVCQDKLAFMYLEGKGVPKDPGIAATWFRKAAEQEYPQGQYNLGVMYSQGIAVNRNYEEAAKWFRKAAEQGYAKAQYNLGILYSKGTGVKKNVDEAQRWFQKAKSQGFKVSQE